MIEISVIGDMILCPPMTLSFSQWNVLAYVRYMIRESQPHGGSGQYCASGTSGPSAVSREYREVLASEGVCVIS